MELFVTSVTISRWLIRTIKPVVKKDDESVASTSSSAVEMPAKQREPSPELARISALITRPPKSKTSKFTRRNIVK